MSRKKYDVVATVGEYQDRQTGETKRRHKNVGAVIQTEHGHALLIDKTFNPAGLAEQGRESVILGLYEPRRGGHQQPSGGFEDTPPF